MITLVVGAGGYLGGEVARRAADAGHEVVGATSASCDITSREAVRELFAAVRPQLVINTAYRLSSWTVCADGAANVALAAAENGSRLVHISTDALHRGREMPYPDDEPPTPITPYGAAKAAAETAVAAIVPAAVIVRTSLLIGDERSQQIRLALDLATGRRAGALFTDEYRRPIAVQDLAAAVLELAGADYRGLLNVAGPETLSRAELGRLAVTAAGLDRASLPTCTTAEGGLGPRPGNVLLDSSRAASMLSTTLRAASECVRASGL